MTIFLDRMMKLLLEIGSKNHFINYIHIDVTVKSRGNETNTEYKASKAEMDTKIWIGNDAKIHSLPPSLSESIVFLLPYELSKSSSNLSISVKYPSIIYIGYAPNEVRNYSYGWTKRSFSKMGFEEVKRERNNSNDVKIKHHLYGICSFTLFRKSLDGENLEYELQEADTLNANVVIFVVEGNLSEKLNFYIIIYIFSYIVFLN